MKYGNIIARASPRDEVAETSRTPPLNPPPFGKCPVCPSPAEGANVAPTEVRCSGLVRAGAVIICAAFGFQPVVITTTLRTPGGVEQPAPLTVISPRA
jgi:hypothetical protein